VDACTTHQHTAATTNSSSTNNTSKYQAVRVPPLVARRQGQHPCLLVGQQHRGMRTLSTQLQLQPIMQGLAGH
jgi:hypothetical protein